MNKLSGAETASAVFRSARCAASGGGRGLKGMQIWSEFGTWAHLTARLQRGLWASFGLFMSGKVLRRSL